MNERIETAIVRCLRIQGNRLTALADAGHRICLRALLAFAAALCVLSRQDVAPAEADIRASTLSFPRDYGRHPAYRREWWSLSGRVATKDGRRLYVQTSFFRYSFGSSDALYSGEYSIVDGRTGKMHAEQRSARDFVPTLPAQPSSIDVDDWRLTTTTPRDSSSARIDVRVGDAINGLSLDLRAQKPPTRSLAYEGYSLTRLLGSGSLRVDGVSYAVSGRAWLDHEYERSAATVGRIGWERFELQFDDGRDIELFSSRQRDGRFRLPSQSARASNIAATNTIFGTREPMDALVIDRAGRAHRLSPERVALIVRGNTLWHSPHDDASYPALWQLAFDAGAQIAIAPRTRDQELIAAAGGVNIWYGAVDLAQADPPGLDLGAGFVELTGYFTPTPL